MRAFQPAHYCVLAKKIEPAKKQGSIHLPEDTLKDSFQATVVAVGKYVDDFRAGDHVYYEPYKGISIIIDDEHYFVLKNEDILGHLP